MLANRGTHAALNEFPGENADFIYVMIQPLMSITFATKRIKDLTLLLQQFSRLIELPVSLELSSIMFTKTAVFFCLSVVATLAAAANPPRTIVAEPPSATTIAQCNTGEASRVFFRLNNLLIIYAGDAQCCNTAGAANNLPGVAQALGLLGVVLGDPTVTVGLNCIPIEVMLVLVHCLTFRNFLITILFSGAGQGANCAEQPVCCSNNNFNGLVSAVL